MSRLGCDRGENNFEIMDCDEMLLMDDEERVSSPLVAPSMAGRGRLLTQIARSFPHCLSPVHHHVGHIKMT